MDQIKVAEHQLRAANKPHPMIFVNDRSLSEYLSELLDDEWISGLAPAITWLWDENEVSATTSRFTCEEIGSTCVPLLICPDDCDLSCTVLMVEVEITENSVKWSRFGYDRSKSTNPNEIGTTIRWMKPEVSFEFSKDEYFGVRDELVSLANIY